MTLKCIPDVPLYLLMICTLLDGPDHVQTTCTLVATRNDHSENPRLMEYVFVEPSAVSFRLPRFRKPVICLPGLVGICDIHNCRFAL
jgi:hypothetical protein